MPYYPPHPEPEPNGPEKKRGKKQFIICIRLRTAAGEMKECALVTEDGGIPMALEREDEWFSYYSAEITSKGEAVRYVFRLLPTAVWLPVTVSVAVSPFTSPSTVISSLVRASPS